MLQIQNNFPLRSITTLQIGGPAKEYVIVKTEDEVLAAVSYTKEKKLPFLIIGGGSNLLVADEGVDKLVIKNEIVGVKIATTRHGGSRNDERILTVKSGTALQDLVNYAIENGLAGLQKLTGVPGTVGGAIFGNAGAYGQTISDYLLEVKALDPDRLQIVTLSKNECNFSYRDSDFKRDGLIILEAVFVLAQKDKETLKQESEDILSKRLVKYPLGIKCPGSFFKNIPTDTLGKEILDRIPKEKIVYGKIPAGSLLEEVGAKGQSLNGIEIAPYHANLFINAGGGTAKAFYNLAREYAQKVKERFGITLEPEVQLINLPSII